nr:immunoglobulin light chain junction region [Macaca mulatta]
CQQYNSVPYNF